MGIQKAIAALLTNVVLILAYFGLNMDWFTQDIAMAVSAVLTPLIVYLIPNKSKYPPLHPGAPTVPPSNNNNG